MRQDRSLQVAFPEYDLYVGAVPARPYGDGTWEIPQKGDANEWVRTNPDGLTELSSMMNANHDQCYVPTVKLLRQTRRALLGTRKPGGFFIEMAAYQAFASGAVSGKAAPAFRELLGKNGDGDTVLPMPPGFNEDGSKKASAVSPGARVVPAGERTFG
ncbi:hypothetical protein ACFRH6_05955 [Streptomyces sp. NPDC056749]|uniref:hypothetical protein n=1 Tax=Streptomyces sp. NPDC056749 TaxID=3345936 RepID=UPI0036A6BE72